MYIRLSAILFVMLLTAGCQSGPTTKNSNVGKSGEVTAQGTGFLSDYSQLKPAPDRDGIMLYVDRTGDFRPYTKVMFDPVQVYVVPGPDQAEVPSDAIARMKANFQQAFKNALEPKYQIVTTPGPDVLRVKSAITGVQAVKPDRGITDYVPIKAAFNLGREAVGSAPRVAEMTAEMEVLDPMGRRVAAATSTRKGDTKLQQGQQVTWAELNSISNYWAQGFRMRLDELRGDLPGIQGAAPRQ